MAAQRLEHVALMALIAFAFFGTTAWYYTVCMTSLLATAVLYRKVSQNWLFWTVVTSVNGFALVQLWLDEGNHLYLNFYISLAILTALLSRAPKTIFKLNARLIIGLVFTFATLWKLFTPSFISGEFFRYYLAYDERLAPIGVLLTDLTFTDVAINRERLKQLPEAEVSLISTPSVRVLATVLTLLTILLEGAVATCFLWPSERVSKIRDAVLLLFMIGAYLTVPVPAFGMAFACLGYGQSRWKYGRVAFLIVFIVQPLTTVRYYLTPL